MWKEEASVLPLLAPGDIEKIHDACLFMEPTCDIGIMVSSSRELFTELKTIIPARVRGQRARSDTNLGLHELVLQRLGPF